MWRLIFSRYKLDVVLHQNLQSILDNYEYSCGASLAELKLPEDYKEVEIRDHECNDPIEILHYSAKYSPICIYCATEQVYEKDDEYPMCQSCIDKPTIILRLKNKHTFIFCTCFLIICFTEIYLLFFLSFPSVWFFSLCFFKKGFCTFVSPFLIKLL